MSHYNVKPVEITLRPSWLLVAWLIGLHVMVLMLALTMPLPWTWSWLVRLLLAVALTTSLAYHLAYQALRRLPHSVIELKLSVDGAFAIRLGSGGWLPTEVLGSSFVNPGLTILNLRLEGRRLAVNVVLLPDALDAEAFRRLRVWLKWGAKASLN